MFWNAPNSVLLRNGRNRFCDTPWSSIGSKSATLILDWILDFVSLGLWCVVVWQNRNGAEKNESERFQKSRISVQRAYHKSSTRCHWLFAGNRKCRSARSKSTARCQSWEYQSQIPSNPVEFMKKNMQKKLNMPVGPNLANVQTFEVGKSGFWTKNGFCWIKKHAHLSELIGSTCRVFFAWFLSIRR